MTEPGAVETDETYTYRPSLLGAPWRFTLAPDGIQWTAGRQSGHVPYDTVRRVRLSYRPANMQSHRFQLELWAEGAPKLRLVSTSWKSMFEQERLDTAYAAFVAALHAKLRAANAPALYQQGSSPFAYWPGLVLFTGVALGIAVLIVRALQSDALAGAAFIGAFLALFLWHGVNFFHRNRPGLYRPDDVPPALLPKA